MSETDATRDRKLTELISTHRTLVSGHLRLLSLDRISQEMGEKWEKRNDHIQFTIESALRRHLGRGQTFYRNGVNTYVIVFDFDDQERADHICRAISREVLQRLLGDDHTTRQDLAVELRMTLLSTPNARTTDAVATVFEAALDQAPAQYLSLPKDYGAALVSRAAVDDGTIGEVSGPIDPFGAGIGRVAQAQWQRVEKHLLSSEREPSTPDPLPKSIKFRYLPFWNPKAHAFMISRIAPEFHGQDGRVIQLTDQALATNCPGVSWNIDKLTFGQALIDLRSNFIAGRKYVVLIPIHGASLERPEDRTELMKMLQHLDATTMKLIAFELVDPNSISWSELVPSIWSLRGKCRRFFLRRDLRATPWLQTQHLPTGTLGLSARLPPTGFSERQAIEMMNAFMFANGKLGFETMIDNLSTRSLAFGAIGAGFDHIAGLAIAGESGDPTAVVRADMGTVFSGKPG